MQGHRSHLAQAKKCHKMWQEDLDAMQSRSRDLPESHGDDNNQTVGVGECPATDSGSIKRDWNVNKLNPRPTS
jgi:hypothetical protein